MSRKNTDISLSDIGKHFGGRSRTTVIHAIKKIEKDVDNNEQIQEAAETIMEKERGWYSAVISA